MGFRHHCTLGRCLHRSCWLPDLRITGPSICWSCWFWLLQRRQFANARSSRRLCTRFDTLKQKAYTFCPGLGLEKGSIVVLLESPSFGGILYCSVSRWVSRVIAPLALRKIRFAALSKLKYTHSLVLPNRFIPNNTSDWRNAATQTLTLCSTAGVVLFRYASCCSCKYGTICIFELCQTSALNAGAAQVRCLTKQLGPFARVAAATLV